MGRRYKLLAWLGILFLVLMVFVPVAIRSIEVGANMNLMMHRGRGLANACDAYAREHGSLPTTLAALKGDFGVDGRELRFYDAVTKQRSTWLYYPRDLSGGSRVNAPMIVSPSTGSGRRIVVYPDSTSQIVSSKEFDRRMRLELEPAR